MANPVQRKNVSFVAVADLKVDGVSLKAGTYHGYAKQLGVHGPGGQIAWMRPEYSLVLSERDISLNQLDGWLSGSELNADPAIETGQLKVV